MKFGPVPLDQAKGAVLAHSMQGVSDGRKTRIPKGTILTAAHVESLRANDITAVTVARLDPGDIAENDAAMALARAIIPDESALGIRISGAGAGRVNLYAARCGLVRLNVAQIQTINAVDPMITIATVPDFHRADADGMIATIKIISYAVPETALAKAAQNAARAMRVVAPVFTTATLIETTTTPDTPSEKGRNAMTGRLDRMGLTLDDRIVVAHRQQDLTQALRNAPGEIVFILTGSATSDPMDVAPEAVRAAGGIVTRFGMPVDPGNLLFLGHLGDKPVIGLPGCARSPALNGADWVLERVICGIDVTAADIAAMGVGGLLKEIPTRPQPRAG
jgi:molybdenum cofactor cytidylyltransferase